MSDPTCAICDAHRGVGDLVVPVVWRDDLVWVKHVAIPGGTVTLGHLIVETARHAAYVDGLTDDEAAAVGRAIRDSARALRAELDVDAVHAMVLNTRFEHFHEHVVVRHAGTPPEVSWYEVDEWSGAPQGGVADVEALCERLALHFA